MGELFKYWAWLVVPAIVTIGFEILARKKAADGVPARASLLSWTALSVVGAIPLFVPTVLLLGLNRKEGDLIGLGESALLAFATLWTIHCFWTLLRIRR